MLIIGVLYFGINPKANVKSMHTIGQEISHLEVQEVPRHSESFFKAFALGGEFGQ